MGSTFGPFYKTDNHYYFQVSNLHAKIVDT